MKNEIKKKVIIISITILLLSTLLPILSQGAWVGETRRLHHSVEVSYIRWSPDGKYLAIYDNDGGGANVEIFDISAGWTSVQTITTGSDSPKGFDMNNDYVAFSNKNNILYCNDTGTWASSWTKDYTARSADPAGLDFSPNGSWLGVAVNDGNFDILDVTDGSVLHSINTPATAMIAIKFSHNGTYIATGDGVGNVYINDTTDMSNVATLNDATDKINDLNFNYNDSSLAVSSKDENTYIYNTSTWALEHTLHDVVDYPRDISYSHNGTHLGVSDYEGNAIVYNVSDYSVYQNFTATGINVTGAVYFSEKNDTYFAWADGGDIVIEDTGNGPVPAGDEDEWSGWSDTWTISDSHSCTPTGYLYGNWSEFEHMMDGTFDDLWTEANDTQWYESPTSWWEGNYTYNCSGYANSTFSVLNSSGTNRSQGLGWVHKDGANNAPYPFVIFSYNTAQDFDCVLWWKNETFFTHAVVAHWNGTGFTDLDTGIPIEDPDAQIDTIDDISNVEYAPDGYITIDGYYYKYLYNALNGTVWFKFWSGDCFMCEPFTWAVEFTHQNLTRDKACHGIGVLDADDLASEFAWDILNVWELNYTVNETAYCNISNYNESRPHMEFPVINLSAWTDEVWSYLNGTFDGDINLSDVALIMKDNVTNNMNMESRMFELDAFDSGQQNDTVYYYSCMFENFTDINPEAEYDDWLHLQVQMCPEDDIEVGEYGDFMLGIDVDNNRQWDVNDRFYWGYCDDLGKVTFQTFNGNGEPKANIADCDIWVTDTYAVSNLHRYDGHLQYSINIPLADLIKSDNYNINASDVFGLSILTTTSGTTMVTQDPCVWQNWNETSDTTYLPETNNMNDVVYYFYNQSGEIEGFIANNTNLDRWGEGVIVGDFKDDEDIEYLVTIEKTSNISLVEAGSTYVLINYTIYINNTGSGALTNVIINDTRFNCTCHDFNESEFLTCSIPLTNLTNYSCYREFAIGTVDTAENYELWYTINLSNCSGVTTGTVENTATVNATELATEQSTTNQIVWGQYAVRVCVSYETDTTNVWNIGDTVFTIIGVLLIIGAIFSIVVIMRKFEVI